MVCCVLQDEYSDAVDLLETAVDLSLSHRSKGIPQDTDLRLAAVHSLANFLLRA